MVQIQKVAAGVGRRPSIPFRAIGGRIARQNPTAGVGCPCCGAPMSASRAFVDRNSNSLIHRNATVPLERLPLEMMDILCRRAPGVATHNSLAMAIWNGDGEPEDAANCIKVMIYQVRRRLKLLGLDIVNVYGVGYRLEVVS